MPHTAMELSGRHALVTGAGSGIGLATACERLGVKFLTEH